MMAKQIITALTLLLIASIFLIGCSILSSEKDLQTTPTLSDLQITATPAVVKTQQPETELTQAALLDTVIIWIPAEFNPASTSSGLLLQQQIDVFMQNHPGVKIDVRLKEADGTAGLLNSLEKTLSTAPKAAPSLVLISHNDLESAAMRSLIQSPPNFQSILEDEDWYDYARELTYFQNNYYGIPFAADAMILTYRTAEEKPDFENWESFLTADHPLLFPAAETQALFTINLYLSAGGTLYDEQNMPHLDTKIFLNVLEFYASGVASGTILPVVTDYSDDEQVWTAFEDGLADQIICWTSDYFSQESPDVFAQPIPPLGNEPVTIVSGWVWALTDPFQQRMELDMELLQHLTTADFQAAWTTSAGYLPVRPSSLAEWEDPVQISLLSQATISAVNQPTNEILNFLGPAINEAVYNVIIKQSQPSEAARIAGEKINIE